MRRRSKQSSNPSLCRLQKSHSIIRERSSRGLSVEPSPVVCLRSCSSYLDRLQLDATSTPHASCRVDFLTEKRKLSDVGVRGSRKKNIQPSLAHLIVDIIFLDLYQFVVSIWLGLIHLLILLKFTFQLQFMSTERNYVCYTTDSGMKCYELSTAMLKGEGLWVAECG